MHKGGRVPYGQAQTPGRKHFPPDAQGGSHLAASKQNIYSRRKLSSDYLLP